MDWPPAAQLVTMAAAVVTAVGILWTKAVGPFVGRPIGRAIRKELEDMVGELVVGEVRSLLSAYGEQEARIGRLSTDVDALADKLRDHIAEGTCSPSGVGGG